MLCCAIIARLPTPACASTARPGRQAPSLRCPCWELLTYPHANLHNNNVYRRQTEGSDERRENKVPTASACRDWLLRTSSTWKIGGYWRRYLSFNLTDTAACHDTEKTDKRRWWIRYRSFELLKQPLSLLLAVSITLFLNPQLLEVLCFQGFLQFPS
jgi:hypothetical protein